MKREAYFCDVVNCRNLAEDGACVICEQDFCRSHAAGGKLALAFGMHDTNPTRLFRTQSRTLCLLCYRFFETLVTAAVAETVIATKLAAAFDTAIGDLKALKAAYALGARGEDLLKIGGRT